jgi:hypothetical protein
MKILTFLDEVKLDFSTAFFKIIMHNNHTFKLDPSLVCNPIIWLLFRVTCYCLLQNVNLKNILHWYFFSYDFRECKRWILIVDLVLREIQVAQLVNYTFGFAIVAPDRLAIESPNENSIWCAPAFFYCRNFVKIFFIYKIKKLKMKWFSMRGVRMNVECL